MKEVLSELKETIKEMRTDLKDICIDEGVFSFAFHILMLIVFIPFIVISLPLYLFNEWSKTWFDERSDEE